MAKKHVLEIGAKMWKAKTQGNLEYIINTI